MSISVVVAHTRQVNIGGAQKQVVSNQFNSPMGLYSDETLAEAAITNQYVDQYKYEIIIFSSLSEKG